MITDEERAVLEKHRDRIEEVAKTSCMSRAKKRADLTQEDYDTMVNIYHREIDRHYVFRQWCPVCMRTLMRGMHKFMR